MADNAARQPMWRTIVAFTVLLALIALLVPVFPRGPSADIRARFDQVQYGMTEEQVEEVLGGPRGPHDRDREGITFTSAAGFGPGRSHRSWWYFPGCNIEVAFDEDGQVSEKKIEPLPPRSLFGMAVAWCKWAFSSPG
jgi:hypothetical protein